MLGYEENILKAINVLFFYIYNNKRTQKQLEWKQKYGTFMHWLYGMALGWIKV